MCVLLTELQFWVGLAQAPVYVVVAVRLLAEVVQHLSHDLPLVHHQRFGAAVVHAHLYHQLKRTTKRYFENRSIFIFFRCMTLDNQCLLYLFHFGFFELLQSQLDFVCLDLSFNLLLWSHKKKAISKI